MLRLVSGDIFHSTSPKAIAHGVNLDGVAGAGVALAIKKKFPGWYNEYHRECVGHRLALGGCHVWSDGEFTIFNVATQLSWRTLAEAEAIRSGLTKMLVRAHSLEIDKVAMPRIGAGLGGLGWLSVRRIIEDVAAECATVELIVFQDYVANRSMENIKS